MGINFSPFEPEKKLYYAGADYARRENLISAPKPDWTKDGRKLLKEHRLLEKARFENSQELYRIYQAAVKYYGPDNIEIALTQLKEGGVPKTVLNSIVAGSFIPKDPSQDRMYKIQKKTSPLESGESTVNAYYRQINDMMYLSLEHSFDRQVAEKEEKRRKKNKGGEVLNVPNASPEPDQRIDKMTGRPYDQQAGAAFTDQEDRQDPLQRMGFGKGGSVQDPLQRMGFGKGSKVTTKGRKVYEDKDGQLYSERTETVQLKNGKWVNYPTVDRDGNKIPEELFEKLVESQVTKEGVIDFITGETLPLYKDVNTAVKAAKERSKSLLDKDK